MGHSHPHEHGHCHAPKDFGTAFAIGVSLNLAFVVLEVIFGFLSHSLALVADAGHNLSDVLGLGLAWAASILARRAPTTRRTYGLRSSSMLAALCNSVLLLVSVGGIAWEAIRRFLHSDPIDAHTVIWVSAIGILVNTGTALMFMSGRKGDLNIRGAFLHMAADAAISAGVVIAGFAILFTGQMWIDPAVSIIIAAVIIWGTWDLLRDSINLMLHAVPAGIDADDVRTFLARLPNVTDVHDLHIWAMSTTETALTAHLVRSVPTCEADFLDRACRELRAEFHIHHATIQLEPQDHVCELASDATV